VEQLEPSAPAGYDGDTMIQARSANEWVVRLQDGDDVVAAIRGLDVASALLLMGIGMVRDAEIGYWDGSRYLTHVLEAPLELLSLQGNLATNPAGDRIVHAHVSLGRPDGSVLGGHLVRATANNTVELAIQPLLQVHLRRKQEENGLVGLYPELS